MKLTSISIKDFGCIAYRVVEIGPDGAEIKGPTEPIIVPIKEAAAEARGKSRVKVVMPEGEA